MKSTGLVFAEKPSVGVEPTNLPDRSRFGNDGAYTNITDVQLPSGLWVRSFNGVSSRIIIPTHRSLDAIMDKGATIMAWFSAASDGEADSGTIMQSGFTPEVVGFQLYTTEQTNGFMKLMFGHRFTLGSGSWTTSTAIIPINTWIFVALTYNNGNVANDAIMYLNGAPAAVDRHAPVGVRKSDAGIDWVIGGASDGSVTFDGLISLTKAWNYIRSAGKVKQIFEAERHFFGV